MILPIWVATWELDCCQPDAVVGESWRASVFLHPGPPWWVSEYGRRLPPEHDELGVLEVDVDVVRPAPAPEGAALARVDGASIGVVGLQGMGKHHLRGRCIFEGHTGPDGVALDEVECRGIVRRVRRVPLLYEPRGKRMWVPLAQLDPIDVHSTLGRDPDRVPIRGTTSMHDSLLVDLELTPDR